MKYGLSENIYEKIRNIAKNNKKYKFILFGSRARGDYKENSDIDLAIEKEVTEEDKYKIMNEIDLLDIIYKVDLVFLDSTIKKELVESIKRDGVVII
jgi:hypothetical protein